MSGGPDVDGCTIEGGGADDNDDDDDDESCSVTFY
jgi:hypothetical protein